MATDTGRGTAAVLELHRLLVEDTPLDVVRQLAVVRIGELLDGAAALWLDEDGALSMGAFSHADPVVQDEMLALTGGLVHGPHSFLRSVIGSPGTVALTGEQVQASLALMEPPYREFFTRHPVSGMLLQPLRSAGQVLGVLGVSRDTAPYDEADVELLGHVGYVLSVVLQSLRAQARSRAALQAAEEHRAAQERLAATDDLTALLNRRGFSQRLPAATDALAEAVAVLVLDLDDFKAVNDSFGHTTGDALLMSCAASLEAALPPGAVAARTGGDEFAVLVRGSSTEEVRQAVHDLGAAAPRSVRILGVEVPLKVSAGLAVCAPGEAFDPARSLQHADVAMYRAKRSPAGRGTVRLAEYDTATDAAALRRLPDAARLRTGIAVGELVLHYQRFVATREGGREHVEALVRWARDGELLPPADFLPLATEIGAMPEVTEAVLDAAVAQLVLWWAAGREVTVAVNVPATALTGPGLDAVLGRLRRAGLPVDALVVEVTETELVQADAGEAVRLARAAGLAVAVDDFGTGWSSLAYLVDIPFSTVKLDRALVRGVDADPVRRVLVRHCVRFCHELGLTVVAEGVEEQAEQDALTALGVDWLQGFLLHRPAPADEV